MPSKYCIVKIIGRTMYVSFKTRDVDFKREVLQKAQGNSFDNSVSRHHLGLVIFESVSLVHNQTGPLNRAQHSLVNGDQLIGCQ